VPALAALERAAALAHADPTVTARELATVRFALAKALWPDDPVRSRSEATAAARTLPDGRSVQLRREIEAWLAEH
jgi:hypothetical protein